MKYLKKWKIFENHDDIHDTCKKYGITNYTINRDGTIDVDGNVDLDDKSLTKLPLNFNKVSGHFYCEDNNLTSLEGAPQNVVNFSCSGNKITSLEGAPQSVGGDFYCEDNNLTSLEGAPKSVGGGFYCYSNNLTSLEGAPQSVGGGFYCRDNNLTSLEGAPQNVGGGFYCEDNNLTSLEGAPQNVGGDFYCYENQLTSLEGLEFKSFKKIYLERNPVYLVVKKWINKDNRDELIEYFVDMNIIQDNKLIMMRLEAFYEDMDLEMDIDFNKVKKYYKIIE